MNIKNKILSQYRLLKKSSRKIADILLNQPEDFLTKSAQELGELTDTSAASVIRFCKQIGYKGLKEFQIDLAQNLPEKTEQTDQINMIVNKHDQPEVIMNKLRLSLTQNFEELVKLIDLKSLKKVINLINNAQTIYLEGIAASSFAAKDLFYKLIRSGRRVYYNDDTHLALERAYYTTKKDVMICFSYSGQTTELLLAAKQARKNKTPIIAITREDKSPLSELASYILALPDNENLLRVSAIDSTFAEMFVSNLLYLSTITHSLPKIEKEMKATEKLTNQLKEKN